MKRMGKFGKSVTQLAVAAALVLMLCLLLPTLQMTGHRPRSPCVSNLEQIATALHNYHEVYGSFPPAYMADQNGQRMHSWRVVILPFLGEEELHSKYDFEQPWYSKHNLQVAEETGSLYRCPKAPDHLLTRTNYVAVVGPETAWPGQEGTRLDDFRDGIQYTLLVVEVRDAGIRWSEPRDLEFDSMRRQVDGSVGQAISSSHPGGAAVVFADGHTAYLGHSISWSTLRALLTTAGREAVAKSDLEF